MSRSNTVEADEHNRLSLAYQALTMVPQLPPDLVSLDLSHNHLTDVNGLEGCTKLETLIVDGNNLNANCHVPFLPNLRYLSLNHNKVTHLTPLVEALEQNCPKLRWLSLLGNEACPNSLSHVAGVEATEYRLLLLSRLKTLTAIDCTRVTDKERRRAESEAGKMRAGSVVEERRMKKVPSAAIFGSDDEESLGHGRTSPYEAGSPWLEVTPRGANWDALSDEAGLIFRSRKEQPGSFLQAMMLQRPVRNPSERLRSRTAGPDPAPLSSSPLFPMELPSQDGRQQLMAVH
eukprot:EG_transcript_15488